MRSPFHHAVHALLVAHPELLLSALREPLDLASLDLASLDLASLDLASLDLASLDLASLDLAPPNSTPSHADPSRPLELRLRRRGEAEPLAVVAVEIQLSRDEARPPVWLVDHAERHDRLRVPAYLVVVTASPDVAAWAAGPFTLGMITMQPRVLVPLDLLAARGVLLDPSARERITACSDLDVLARWLHRAAHTTVAEEVFAP